MDHDMEVGGGRILERLVITSICVLYLAGGDVVSVCMSALGENPQENTDNADSSGLVPAPHTISQGGTRFSCAGSAMSWGDIICTSCSLKRPGCWRGDC